MNNKVPNGKSIPSTILKETAVDLGLDMNQIQFDSSIFKTNFINLIFSSRSQYLLLNDFLSQTYLYNAKISIDYLSKIKYFIKAIFYILIELLMYRMYKKIFVQTLSEVSYSTNLYLKNITVLTNPYTPFDHKFKYRRHSDILKFGMIAKFENIYLYTARKILNDYSSLFAEIPLTICGDGSLKFKDYKNVIALGVVNELGDFYSQIDACFCFSWKKFGFINKICEAIKFRKIIITNSTALIGMEFLKNSKFVVIIDEDIDSQKLLTKVNKAADITRNRDFLEAESILVKYIGLDRYKENLFEALND
jgi:hypothetical protein